METPLPGAGFSFSGRPHLVYSCCMAKKHDKVLDAIFGAHMSGNLHWKELESTLLSLGAELREAHGARMVVSLGGHEITLHRPHHGSAVGKGELHSLRHFLSAAGVGHIG